MSLDSAYGNGEDEGIGSNSSSAFGELPTVELHPEIQANAVYTLGPKVRSVFFGTATALVSNSKYLIKTGATQGSLTSLFSKRAQIYRAGQGVTARITAAFITLGITGDTIGAGLTNATDGFTVGYDGPDFYLIHRANGQQIIQELDITGAAGAPEVATVTINGTGYPVNLTAATVEQNAFEVADQLQGVVPLWNFEQVGACVVTRSILGEPAVGAFTFSSGTATGTFSEVAAGVNAIVDNIPQDKWDNPNVPWFNPRLGNIYQIDFGWLGYAGARWYVKNPNTNTFELLHSKTAIGAADPIVKQPTFRVGYSGRNSASTTDLEINGSSFAMFNQGPIVITDTTKEFDNVKLAVAQDVLTSIFTIRVRGVYGDKVNLSSIIPELFTFDTNDSKSLQFLVIKNATVVTGNPDFEYLDKENSIVAIDTGIIEVSGGEVIAGKRLRAGGDGEIDISKFREEILPEETLTLAVLRTGASTAECGGTALWAEDV